MPEIFLLFT